MRIRITIAYDGRRFAGWQIQPGKRTVQEELNRALSELYAAPVYVTGAGRTDSGVHARGQVAHFDVASPRVPVHRLVRAARHFLPQDIAIRAASEAASDFHACFSTLARRYIYSYVIDEIFPFEQGIAALWPHSGRPDHARILEILAPLAGEHDFTSFSLKDCSAKTRVRSLQPVTVADTERGFRLDFTADGFLRRMIRMILGQLEASYPHPDAALEMQRILDARDNALCAPAASPAGLYLEEIIYPEIYAREA
ncbi:MAG: tRNA pseudouridine(38-40) synthase TruA [Spirochaetota bacterium]|jgi:tRNA pseudouridine38-40 synthase|nr:tRNA pseudouridine(38-40) synthase TruA [Spirochaetota bacterium]